MGERRKADQGEYVVWGCRWFPDRQPCVQFREHRMQPGEHPVHLLTHLARPHAHLFQISVLQARTESDLVVDQLLDGRVAAKMPDIAGDRHFTSGIEPRMPAAEFLASRQDAISGGRAQLGDQLRGVSLDEGEILRVVFLPRRSRHASPVRADR